MSLSARFNTLLLAAAMSLPALAQTAEPAAAATSLQTQESYDRRAALSRKPKFDALATKIFRATSMADIGSPETIIHDLRAERVFASAPWSSKLSIVLSHAPVDVQQGFKEIFATEFAVLKQEFESCMQTAPVNLSLVSQDGKLSAVIHNPTGLTIAFAGLGRASALGTEFTNAIPSTMVITPYKSGDLGLVDASGEQGFFTTGFSALELGNLEKLVKRPLLRTVAPASVGQSGTNAVTTPGL